VVVDMDDQDQIVLDFDAPVRPFTGKQTSGNAASTQEA